MEDRNKLPLFDAQKQLGEKSQNDGLAVRPSIKVDLIPKRDKSAIGSLQRRMLTRKTVSEGLIERSRKFSADLTSREQRQRAASNVEIATDKSDIRDRSVRSLDNIKISFDSYTVPKLVGSGNVTNVQRRRNSSKPTSNEQPTSHNRPSSKSQEKWAVRRTFSNELPKRKTSLTAQSLSSSSISSTGSRRDVETDSVSESRSTKGTRQFRSSFDGDKYRAGLYTSGSSERREIIEKYVKETKPKVESNNSLMKKTNKMNNRRKSKGVADFEGRVDEDSKDVAKATGGKEGVKKLKGWALLREKLHEVTKLNHSELEMSDVDSDVCDKANEEKQSTEKYLKMLRERLRKCQPADIVASSDVEEITKLRKGIERRRSVIGQNRKESFFETVLTAHALSKQNKLYTKPLRKTNLSKISETNDLFQQNLPSITHNSKFKSSPHFQKTIRLLTKNDLIVDKDS